MTQMKYYTNNLVPTLQIPNEENPINIHCITPEIKSSMSLFILMSLNRKRENIYK
jgi:hypothetical protein